MKIQLLYSIRSHVFKIIKEYLILTEWTATMI